MRINTTTEVDYRTLTKYYTENKIQYHTFRNNKDKPLEVVIKSLPTIITEEVSDELKSMNLSVLKSNTSF